MKRNIILKMVVTLIFGGLSIYGTACSHVWVPSQNNLDTQVERLPNQRVRIFKPNVYLQDDMLVISGAMKGYRYRSRLTGHADIVIVDFKNSIIAKQSIKLYRKPPSRKNYKYKYTAKIPTPSSTEDLTVRIAYHGLEVSELSNCGNNLAINDFDFK
jgi:hypothetical protein